jgi:hypothetical protein
MLRTTYAYQELRRLYRCPWLRSKDHQGSKKAGEVLIQL